LRAIAGAGRRRIRSGFGSHVPAPGTNAETPSPSGAIRPGFHAGAPDQPDYQAWVEGNRPSPEALAAAATRASAFERSPLISVLLPVKDPVLEHLRLALGSVEAQVYDRWELCIVDDASSDAAVVRFLGDYARGRDRVRLLRLERGQHIAEPTAAAL